MGQAWILCYRRRMQTRRLATLLLAIAACGDEGSGNPDQLTDQSGAVFGWDCDETRCRLSRIGDQPPLPDCNSLRPAYSYTWGRFVGISAVCAFDDGGWGSVPQWERFVVCEGDEDCPRIPRYNGGTDVYTCRAGFCQDETRGAASIPNRMTMEQLCLGDIPRFEPHEPSPELTAALDAACPALDVSSKFLCTAIPEGCPDPR